MLSAKKLLDLNLICYYVCLVDKYPNRLIYQKLYKKWQTERDKKFKLTMDI